MSATYPTRRDWSTSRHFVAAVLACCVIAISCAFVPAANSAEPPDDVGRSTGQPHVADPPGYIKEAPLPERFPPPSEPGKVVEKSYPRSRTFSAAGTNAFMKNFVYLAKNKHEMTAPVILDYAARGPAQQPNADSDVGFMDVARMHFILEKPTLDEPQQDGPVTVADMAPMRVLSIALQGDMSPESLADAEQKLADELARRTDVVAAGEKRVLGYNSPMVPRDKSFWEVQLPIKNRAADDAR